ncbi:MAG: serine/threonine-protein kinase [Acidobacteriota bacterium]
MSLAPGRKLGPYEVLSPLGAGGMGEVYRARDTRLGREVAVKVLPSEFAQDPERLRRFEQEARATAALDHPNILVLHDLGIHDGAPYIVTELLEGESLRERLRGGPLPPAKAVGFGIQIAQGLAAAHEKGIVHRDLKLENLFITKDGRVKILDFGLARLTQPESARSEGLSQAQTAEGPTREGTVLGTPGYMAPEQVRGQASDARADLFAFGCVLYEMLSDRRAFTGQTQTDVAAAVLRDDPPDLLTLAPKTSPVLAQIVKRCLEKRPGDRFSSAHDLAFALETLSGSGPALPSGPVERPGGPGRFSMTWGKAALGLAAVVLLGLLAGWVAWRQGAPAGPEGAALNPKRVVVAIFENQTGDPALDPLGRLACDWITQGLSQISQFETVPSTAVLRIEKAGGAKAGAARFDPPTLMGRETGAGLVVSGSYYLQGQTLVLQAKITDASTGKVLYASDPIVGTRENPMKPLDSLRQRVMGAMAVVADPHLFSAKKLEQPPLYGAYREYVAGLELFGEAPDQAIGHFNRAVQLDPSFSGPKLYIASAYTAMGQYEAADAILEELNKHRETLPPINRAFLDWGRAQLDGRWTLAMEALRETEKLDPKSTMTCYAIGMVALFADRPGVTVDLFTRLSPQGDLFTTSTIPNSWSLNVLAAAYHMLGDYDRELAVSDHAVHELPDILTTREGRVRALAALGRAEEVRSTIEEGADVLSRQGRLDELMLVAASELRTHGNREASLQMANRAADWLGSRPPAEKADLQCALMLANALYAAQRWEEARLAFERLSADHPLVARPQATTNAGGAETTESESQRVWTVICCLGPLGALAARRGDRATALRISDELARIDTRFLFGAQIYWRACIAALLGDRTHAVDLLREALAAGMPYVLQRSALMLMPLHQDMNLEPLHGYPPYEELLKPQAGTRPGE